MLSECKEWGIPEPEFEDTGTSIVVSFSRSVLTPETLEKVGLNERQIKAVYFIKENKKITTKDYCILLGVARDTANRDLKLLLRKNIIEKKGTGPKIYYVLSNVSIGQYRTVSDSRLIGNDAVELNG